MIIVPYRVYVYNFSTLIVSMTERHWRLGFSHVALSQAPGSNDVQCYCPASGQLLGTITPSTPDGIDRAWVRAKDAQTEWAKTTFSERRKVLRTILR